MVPHTQGNTTLLYVQPVGRLAEWADYPERVIVQQQQIALLETVNARLEQELELERVNAGRAEDRQGDDAAEAAEVEGML